MRPDGDRAPGFTSILGHLDTVTGWIPDNHASVISGMTRLRSSNYAAASWWWRFYLDTLGATAPQVPGSRFFSHAPTLPRPHAHSPTLMNSPPLPYFPFPPSASLCSSCVGRKAVRRQVCRKAQGGHRRPLPARRRDSWRRR